MSIPTVNDLAIYESKSLRDAMQCLDANASGVCFVVDQNYILKGVLTDGDIRRCLLGGFSLQTVIEDIVSEDYVVLNCETPASEIRKLLDRRIRYIPLIDHNGVLVDYASFNRIHRFQVMEPLLNGNELEYVMECVRTNWISSQGKFVTEFENKFSEFLGVPYSLAVSNGTSALHLALLSLGIGPGDEVLVPDLTFAASINSIIYTGATPVLVDVSMDDWTIDIQDLKNKITKNTKAIMPVHLYGHPCKMDEIIEIAGDEIYVVEDCAESLGATYRGQQTGSFGNAGTFSFFGNKIITTGEGGMVVFKDEETFLRAKRLRDHGMNPSKRYWHDMVGYNYRLTNLQAAIGCAQMERVDNFIFKKKEMARSYAESLGDCEAVILPPEASVVESVYWLYTIQIKSSSGLSRDEIANKLLMNGIETRPVFYPLHQMPIYQKYSGNGSYPNSCAISECGLSLPSAVTLTDENIRWIGDNLKNLIKLRADVSQFNV